MEVVMKLVRHDLGGNFAVTENIYIPLSDGARLSARVWLPVDATGSVSGRLPCELAGVSAVDSTAAPLSARAAQAAASREYPAILEYIPYRKRDGTRTRDEPMHGFFSAHGYACVRVDMRGTGESDGVFVDEYLQQEQDDALEVIQWIAAQPWCDGNVGMMGKSWGGFNSLQVAALQPPALRAIVVLGFTDNRFTDDIHWKGGCLLNDNLWWGSLMQAFIAQPVDPEIVGHDVWMSQWMERLARMPFNAATWASHQTYDAYWRHGSVCENYDSIRVPVMMVDGWADSYTNPVFHLLEHLSVRRRAVVGPWVHAYPQDGVPTPPMNFLREALDWWDLWLKPQLQTTSSLQHLHPLRVFIEDGMPPSASKPACKGKWLGLGGWPNRTAELAVCRLHADRTITMEERTSDSASSSRADSSARDAAEGSGKEASAAPDVVLVHTPLNHGMLSGEWMGAGVLGETPSDQRLDNGLAVTFTSAALQSAMNLLGQPVFEVVLTCDCPKGLLFVQLCDVAPDGAATRITYGLKNLVHTGPKGDATIQLLQPDTPVRACVMLDYCGYCVPAGHRLAVSVANNYWPMVWPSPANTTLALRVGTARLELPFVRNAEKVTIAGPEVVPEVAPATPQTRIRPGRVDRSIHYDIVKDAWTCVTDGVGGVFGEGVYRFDDIDTTIEHNLRRELQLSNKDPLSATYRIDQSFKTSRPGWNTQTNIVTTQTCDYDYLHMRTHMTSFCEGKTVFEKNWYQRVRREAI